MGKRSGREKEVVIRKVREIGKLKDKKNNRDKVEEWKT